MQYCFKNLKIIKPRCKRGNLPSVYVHLYDCAYANSYVGSQNWV